MNLGTKIASVFLGTLIVAALVIPFIAQVNPNAFNPYELSEALPPNSAHWFGTDDLGRDQLVRCIYGARVSLLVALISVVISVSVGTVVGLVSGFFAGWLDELLMRFVDVMMGIPTLFLILIVEAILQ
jgi:peptide/nickel transport system permease protein